VRPSEKARHAVLTLVKRDNDRHHSGGLERRNVRRKRARVISSVASGRLR
jgi:hypothetical protein